MNYCPCWEGSHKAVNALLPGELHVARVRAGLRLLHQAEPRLPFAPRLGASWETGIVNANFIYKRLLN